MLLISVAGGTNAGVRSPKAAYPNDWKCPDCAARNKYYWLKCPNCGHRRPDR